MYLFGGGGGMCENLDLFCLDLTKFQWTLLKPQPKNNDKNSMPVARDEHSCVVHDDSMVIFGGFNFGRRTNQIFKYYFGRNVWEQIIPNTRDAPCARVGHSAVLKKDAQGGDCMYIFGGKDDENNKLSDTWKFNFNTLEWTQIRCADEPIPRSGHTASIYKDNFMIIYGGIYEITKELNDMHIFDMK